MPGEDGQDADEVGGVPLARHVRLAEADQPVGPDPPEEGVGPSDLHERPALADAVVPGDPDAQGQPAQGVPDEAFGHGGPGP
ncbi:hypothetical protein GA0115239_12754 [Streptomyces sp. BpilaLS-43]|nr:hypothetical protein GA0115239_12754 [Streptomyces sp. BpilaLS-43]